MEEIAEKYKCDEVNSFGETPLINLNGDYESKNTKIHQLPQKFDDKPLIPMNCAG